MSYLFGIGTTRPTKCWERNFDFFPSAGINWAGRCGWARWRKKFWISEFFHKIHPYSNKNLTFFYFCHFVIGCTLGAPRVHPGGWRVKIKVHFWSFFIKTNLLYIKIQGIFIICNISISRIPEALGPRKSPRNSV